MTIDKNRSSKKCSRCDTMKDRPEFYFDSNRKDGMTSYCKKCMDNKNRMWRERNPEAAVQSRRNTHRKRAYGVDVNMFEEMLLSQNGLCAICDVEIDGGAAVDHCHSTGRVRGLLCTRCNLGLGMFGDDKKILLSALKYLEDN